MFKFVFLVSAIATIVSSKNPFQLIYGSTNNDFQDIKYLDEDILNKDIVAEIAALRNIIKHQGQETAVLRKRIDKQELDTEDMKQEITVLQKTNYEQEVQIKLLSKEKTDIKLMVQQQKKQLVNMGEEIKRMQTQTEKQGAYLQAMVKENGVLKENITAQNIKNGTLKKVPQNGSQIQSFSTNGSDIRQSPTRQLKERLNSTYLHNVKVTQDNANFYNAGTDIQESDSTTQGIAFSAYLGYIQNSLPSGHTIKCDNILLNDGNSYNHYTGVFHVPKTGVYLLTFFINSMLEDSYTFVQLVINGRNTVDAVTYPRSKTHDVMGGNSAIVRLNSGDSVWLEINHGTGQLQSNNDYRFVTFSGVLLYPVY